MKFILSTHNITLTQAIEEHVLDRIDRLEHLDRWLIDARVTLEKDHEAHSPEKTFKCAVRLGVKGNDLFAEDKKSDLYTAIDCAVKKLELQLRKRHKKITNRKHTDVARAKEKAKAGK